MTINVIYQHLLDIIYTILVDASIYMYETKRDETQTSNKSAAFSLLTVRWIDLRVRRENKVYTYYVIGSLSIYLRALPF